MGGQERKGISRVQYYPTDFKDQKTILSKESQKKSYLQSLKKKN